LYLPTHRGGAEIQQDPIRLKNLIRQAMDAPSAKPYRAAELAALLKPVQELTANAPFWHEQEEGLAIFRAPDFLRTYRLPERFSELAVVADRFHVKPLMPVLLGEGRFRILALSQKSVRLYQATRHHVAEAVLPGAPKSLAEALRYDETERELRGRQRASRASAGAERLYPGRGHDETDVKEQIARFFKQVDQGVGAALRYDRVPLILAGVEFELAIYRSLNTYPRMLDSAIPGSPDGLSPGELHQRAWAMLQPHFLKEREAAEARFRQLSGTGQATNDLAAVLPAAHEGRVESLFVAVGLQRWGRFHDITYTTEVHAAPQDGDEDLLDLAAIQTLLHHGRVFAVPPAQVPDDGTGAPLAAVFRY
jgi:hypothetical protein